MNIAPKLSEAIETLRKYRNNGSVRIWDMDAALDVVLAALAPPSGEGVDTRVAFERWVAKRWGCANDKWADSGEYRYDDTRNWWQCWQAAIASSNTTPQSAPVDGDTRALLIRLRDLLASKPVDCLGTANDGELEWPVRDEVIDSITKALTTPPPASQERGGKVPTPAHWLNAIMACVSASKISESDMRRIEAEAWRIAEAYGAMFDASRASPPSSVAEAKEPEQRCPYCAGRIYSAAGCQNCKVGSVWPKPIAAEQDSSAAVGCNHQWVPDTEVEGVSYCAWCRVTRGDAAEQAKPDDCQSCGQPQAGELPPRCAAARTLGNETLVEVALQAAGRASLIDSEIHRSRYSECRTELLRRLAGGVTVDDAMVERACISHYPRFDSFGESTKIACRFEMRRVLSAALVAALEAK